MTTYYVSTSGDDDNDGLSPDTPWQTTVKAQSFNYQPTDSVLFKRGDDFNNNFTLNTSGTNDANRFTVGAYGEWDAERPKINRFFINELREYVNIQDLYCRSRGGLAVSVGGVGANNISFIRVMGDGEGLDTDQAWSVRGNTNGTPTYNFWFYRCQTKDAGSETSAQLNGFGVGGNCEDFLYEECEGWGCNEDNFICLAHGTEGQYTPPRRITYRNCVSHDTIFLHGFEVGWDCTDIVFDHCIAYNCNMGIMGIRRTDRVTIQNCVAYNNRIGLSTQGTDPINYTMDQNTVYQALDALCGIEIDTNSGAGHTITNSIVNSNGKWHHVLRHETQEESTLSGNHYYSTNGTETAKFYWKDVEYTSLAAYQTASGQDADSVESNPMFNSPGNADFSLQAGSPALSKGAYPRLNSNVVFAEISLGHGIAFTQQPRLVSQTSSSVTVDAVVESEATSPINPEAFCIEVVTPSDNYTIKFEARSSAICNGDIDFGDGNSASFTSYDDANLENTYETAGNYIVNITGQYSTPRMQSSAALRDSVVRLLNLGPVTSLHSAFYSAPNLISATTIAPSSVISIDYAFQYCGIGGQGTVIDLGDSVFSGVPTARSSFASTKFERINAKMLDDATLSGTCWDTFSGSTVTEPLHVGGWDLAGDPSLGGTFQSIADDIVAGLASWDISNQTSFDTFLQSTKITTAEYDATLIAWQGQPHQSNVPAHFGSSVRTSASDAAFNALIADGWTITDSNGTSP